jgi:hypothetical protein
MITQSAFGVGGMALVAAVLGATLAWLLEAGLAWLRQQVSRRARRRIGAFFNVLGYAAVLYAFVFISSIFVRGIYSRNTGNISAWSVRALDLILLPNTLGTVVAFALGVVLYRVRKKAGTFISDFASFLFLRRGPAATTPSASGSEITASVAAARDTYPWLTSIVGIAAVSLVAIVTLIIFFPEVLTRVELIKVGGVEARFAAAASRSVQTNTASHSSRPELKLSLSQWLLIDSTFANLIIPVQQAFLQRSKASQEDAARRVQATEWAQKFLNAVAVPIAKVMDCYSTDHSDKESTDVRNKITEIAHDWARFAAHVSEMDPQKRREEFEAHWLALESFVEPLNDLFSRRSTCGFSPENATCARDQRPNAEYFARLEKDLDVIHMGQHLSEIFSNGYVIIFIADMVLAAGAPNQALDFLNAVEEHLDKSDETSTGQFNFYYTRSTAQFLSQSPELPAMISDIKQARARAEKIAEAVNSSGKRRCPSSKIALEQYYCALIAETDNDLIFAYVSRWLEGHRPSPLELSEMEKLAKKLSRWLEDESYTALLPKSGEINPLRRGLIAANAYDTLALYELMVGSVQPDLTKERCVRVASLLADEKNLWEELRPQLGGAYRGAVDVYLAHEDLYINACQT